MAKERRKAEAESTELVMRFSEWLESERGPAATVMAIKENYGDGMPAMLPSDLIRITVPTAGGAMWTWEELGHAMSASELCGQVVHMASRGVIWPTEDVGRSSIPFLVTDDFITAYQVGDDPGDLDISQLESCRDDFGNYAWTQLPWTQFGSGKNGVGKRAKEQRLLYLLRQGHSLPCVIQAPATSLGSIRQFLAGLTSAGYPFWSVMASFSLAQGTNASGIAYSRVIGKMLGALDLDVAKRNRELFAGIFRRSAATGGSALTDG